MGRAGAIPLGLRADRLPLGSRVRRPRIGYWPARGGHRHQPLGELGAFVADTLSADLTFYANGLVPTEWDEVANFRGVREGDVVRFAIAKPEPLRLEHEAFRDAVLGIRSDIVTMEQGVAVTRIADAILRSAATGTEVSL